ncbi:uncharacterized protein LOC135499391 [Lineus longissimus]|uniref:uncharacterized protein LOC135499391 n=1 Tax=Lineus longissimus TaxID=88925 RepID=UPI00315DB914
MAQGGQEAYRLNRDGGRVADLLQGTKGGCYLTNQVGHFCRSGNGCGDARYDTLEKELVFERNKHKKETDYLVKRLLQEQDVVKKLKTDNGRKDDMLFDVKKHARTTLDSKLKSLSNTMLEKYDSKLKKCKKHYEAELQALRGKVDDSREELWTTKEAARRNLEDKIFELDNNYKKMLFDAILTKEEDLKKMYEKKMHGLKARYEKYERNSEEELRTIKESWDELQRVLLRGMEVSPNDALRLAAEFFDEHMKKSREDWQAKEARYEDTISRLEKDAKDKISGLRKDAEEMKKSQQNELMLMYDGLFADLQREKEELEARIRVMEQGHLKERSDDARRKKELLQRLEQYKNTIKDIKRSAEAKEAKYYNLMETLGNLEERYAAVQKLEKQTNCLHADLSVVNTSPKVSSFHRRHKGPRNPSNTPS